MSHLFCDYCIYFKDNYKCFICDSKLQIKPIMANTHYLFCDKCDILINIKQLSLSGDFTFLFKLTVDSNLLKFDIIYDKNYYFYYFSCGTYGMYKTYTSSKIEEIKDFIKKDIKYIENIIFE